ncbi:MAG: ATP-binding protein [bacterium]|nr:ATP-binding protein [bacterium]
MAEIRNIQNVNPWWQSEFEPKSLPEFSLRKRFAYHRAQQVLNETKLMLQIKGLRRLGKSTIMKQLILDLLEQKVDLPKIEPQKIIFYEFSKLSTDLSNILQRAPQGSYIFLDEIQYCDNWRDVLKEHYDTNATTRIIFSGSATLSYTITKESLLGRFMPLDLKPLHYQEYLYLKYGSKDNLLLYNDAELWEYLQYGEFPELLQIKSDNLKQAYLQDSVLTPLLTQDISLYNVDKKEQFAAIFKAISSDPGQVVSKKNLAREIGLSRPAIDKYLAILTDVGLIKTISNYYTSSRKELRSDKKIYITTLNLALAYLGISDLKNFPTAAFRGHIFENFVFNELSVQHKQIYYWKRQSKELDFLVTKTDKTLLAYEVKAAASINQKHLAKYKRYASQIKADLEMLNWNIEEKQSNLLKLLR